LYKTITVIPRIDIDMEAYSAKKKRYYQSKKGQRQRTGVSEGKKQLRREMCGLHTLANNQTAAQVAKTIMHQCIERIGNVSLVEYAKNTSGVYIWMTSRQKNAIDIRNESVRFITDG
jgi:hypothetical protein